LTFKIQYEILKLPKAKKGQWKKMAIYGLL